MRTLIAIVALAASLPLASRADDFPLSAVSVTEWKAVYGRIEARSRIPARARLGGTLVSLDVSEGDVVTAGQVLAQIVDAKIGYQLAAIDAQLQALTAQMDNAKLELTRGEVLLARGVTTAQRLDALRTQVDVLIGQIAAAGADRKVVEQQALEGGAVLAPRLVGGYWQCRWPQARSSCLARLWPRLAAAGSSCASRCQNATPPFCMKRCDRD